MGVEHRQLAGPTVGCYLSCQNLVGLQPLDVEELTANVLPLLPSTWAVLCLAHWGP